MYRGTKFSMLLNRHARILNPARVLFSVFLILLLLVGTGQGKDGDVRLEVARQWSEKGDYDKAVLELRRYLSEHPDAAEIYSRIGGMRAKQGNFKLAAANYRIAVAKDPNLLEARQGLALAYDKTGEREKAAESWQALLQLTQDPAIRKQAEIRLAELRKALASKPISPIVQSHKIGHSEPIHQPDSDFSPALDSGSSTGPQGLSTQKEFQTALRLYREKKSDSALIFLRKSLGKSPKHPGAFYLGGVIRFERGEYAKALFNFQRCSEYLDRGFNSNYYLGRIYQKQDRQNLAIEAYEKYLRSTKSVLGKKVVQGYLEQMNVTKTEIAAHVPEPEPAHQATQTKPQDEAQELAQTGAHGKAHDTPQSTAHGGTHEPAHEGAHGGADEPTHETVYAPQVTDGKPLLLGRDGPLFFIIPDSSSVSGKKLLEAFEACRREKYEKAENILKETALAYGGSDNAEAATLNMASVYLQLGLWENAQSRLTDYMAASAKDSIKYRDGAYYLAAVTELGRKDGERAERYLLKVKPGATFGPSQEEIDFRLAQAGELLKDNKKWAGYLEKAYTGSKQSLRKALMAQKLGYLHSKFGSTERSMDYFRKSLQDCGDTASPSPENLASLCAESSLRLADMTFKKKDWKSALAQYKQFATKYPDHKELAWVHYQIANIYKVTNNFESALNEYKKVIDNYPDSYWASQAKWKREDAIWQKEYEEVLD
jgi:tetratricopeptide (TPR) repeat protein